MPLNIPVPPAPSQEALRRGLQSLPARNKQRFITESMGGAAPSVSLPHQVFVLRPDDVLRGSSLDASQPTGWRYLLDQPVIGAAGGAGTSRATAEVSERGGQHQFVNLQHGWMAAATKQAFDKVSALPSIASGSYSLRFLRIPALYLDALWLKDTAQNRDLVVPIASRGSLVAAQVYEATNFLTQVRSLATAKSGFDNRPK
jgi:hypothetical protein